jgi:RNA polymerase sigma factor (sigma-70 family)
MTPESLTGVVHRLRVAVDPAAPQRADADLVRAVARHRDPVAFADIVRRHGPMVLGTCRRVLRDHADADDAFQATFLVFLRRAASLRHPERLAGWLFQVAYRTSQKVRAVRLARRGREVELFDLPAGEPPAEFVWRELRPIFDAELARLPDKLRLPAVLCLLEGRSKRDAARTLGWPEGTIAGRLQQARELLRRRFAARGLTLSTGALAVALFEGAGAVAVPPALFASTIHGLAAGSASAGAAALADGVVHAMFVTKVKAITAAVLLTGIVGTGTGVVLTPGPGPGVALADGPVKEKGPAPRDTTEPPLSNDPKLLRNQIEALRTQLEGARSHSDKAAAEADQAKARLWRVLDQRLTVLRTRVKGAPDPAAEFAALKAEIAAAESELRALTELPDDAPSKELDRLRKERVELQRELAKQREGAALADLQAKDFRQKNLNLLHQIEMLTIRVRELEQPGRRGEGDAKPAPPGVRGKVIALNQGSTLAQINIGSDAGLAPGHVLTVFAGSEYKGELTIAAVDPKTAVGKFAPVRRGVEIKKDDSVVTTIASADPDRAAQRARLEADIAQLRDRKAYTERMVQKGFMTQAQLAADAARLAEAEALLAKFDAAPPKGPEPGPTADELAAKLREIDREKQAREVEALRERLEQMEELLRKGLVTQIDVDAAKVQLFQAEVELRKLAPPPAADARRTELEDRLRKLTAILKQTEVGRDRTLVPEIEFVQAQLRVLQVRFELLGLDAQSDPKVAAQQKEVQDQIVDLLDRTVALAEQGYRRGVIPVVELKRTRADAAVTKAELQEAVGRFDRAVGHREAAVKELDAILQTTQAGNQQGMISAASLREALLAVAEAKANAHRTALRKELAEIVTLREEDVRALKKRANTGAAAREEVRRAEQSLAEARARLAEGR